MLDDETIARARLAVERMVDPALRTWARP